MVSVAFAIWLPSTPERPRGPLGSAHYLRFRHLCSKRRASLQGCLTPLWLRYCIAIRAGADSDDVDDVSGLSEPHGPDGSMAERGCIGAEISQPRAARRIRPAVRAARRRAGADLAHLADLYPPTLRDR